MIKDPKIETIERFFAAYAAHDTATLASVLAEDIEWTIPGRHPLSGTKRGVAEVVAFFDQLGKAGFKADPVFLGANDEYVVDIHRGWSTQLVGKVDTTWALVWRFGPDGKIRNVVNLSADQAQMDAFCWANFPLAPIPDRLASAASR
jgi:ketosteroid isomerase-like protein